MRINLPFSKKATTSKRTGLSKKGTNSKRWLQTIQQRQAAITAWVTGVLVLVLVAGLATGALWPRTKASEEVVTPAPLAVDTIVFGQDAIETQTVGVVKNLNTVTLVAQSNGPVNALKVVEGSAVKRGSVILQQSSVYAGGNAAAVQRQIAQKNYELAESTLNNTATIVSKTREQADLNRDNTEELRKITEKSIDETKGLISLTETQLSELEDQLDEAVANNASPDVITGLRGAVITTQSSLAQARSSLRNIEYQVDTDNPPTKLASSGKDLVYASTQLQLEAAQIQKDIASLSLRAARIAESATRVAAPFAGTVEKVYVKEGEFVAAGTPVAVLKGTEAKLCLQIAVAGSLAGRINEDGSLKVNLGGTELQLPINHVTGTTVQGQLYEVLTLIPNEYTGRVYENQSLEVSVPLYAFSRSGGNATLPLDAIFVTNSQRYVLVAENGKAVRHTITTGEIYGENIEVTSGIEPGAEVILDRRIIENQSISIDSN